jgi:hypothetical protein
MVVDPKKEAVTLRYAGGATVPQLKKLLTDARTVTKSKADEALARARSDTKTRIA